LDITNRPKVVDARDRLGDWEGDTVHGRNAHLVTLVDRRSLFTRVERVLRKTKELVADAMIKMLKKVKSVLTITLDNGGEFADHVRVSKATGCYAPFLHFDKGCAATLAVSCEVKVLLAYGRKPSLLI
jgi:IS30 family transposase